MCMRNQKGLHLHHILLWVLSFMRHQERPANVRCNKRRQLGNGYMHVVQLALEIEHKVGDL